MSIRQTFRENWDVGFLVVVLGLILGWAIFVSLLMPLLGQSQVPVFENEVWKRTGENIQIQWTYPEDPRVYQFRLLRCTESGSCTTIAQGGPATREFNVLMNSGSTKRYYLKIRAVVIVDGIQRTSPASSEMIVNRL